MADSNITTFQDLLKRLEGQANCLSSLTSQASLVSSRLKDTWAAIKSAQETCKRDIEKH